MEGHESFPKRLKGRKKKPKYKDHRGGSSLPSESSSSNSNLQDVQPISLLRGLRSPWTPFLCYFATYSLILACIEVALIDKKVKILVRLAGTLCIVVAGAVIGCIFTSRRRLSQAESPFSIIAHDIGIILREERRKLTYLCEETVPRLFGHIINVDPLLLPGRLLRSVHSFGWRGYLMLVPLAIIIFATISSDPLSRRYPNISVAVRRFNAVAILSLQIAPLVIALHPIWAALYRSRGWRVNVLLSPLVFAIAILELKVAEVISMDVFYYMEAVSNIWLAAVPAVIVFLEIKRLKDGPRGRRWLETLLDIISGHWETPWQFEQRRLMIVFVLFVLRDIYVNRVKASVHRLGITSSFLAATIAVCIMSWIWLSEAESLSIFIANVTLSERGRRRLTFLYEETVQVKEGITAALLVGASSLKDRVLEEAMNMMEMLVLRKSGFEAFSMGILFLLGAGYEFDKNKLIQLWMANRFLSYERMEIICAKHFEKLVSEGYILCPPKASSLYKVNSEKVYSYFNTIRDKSNYLKLGNRDQPGAVSFGDVLHISVLGDRNANEKVLSTLKEFCKLRTLLFLGNYGSRAERLRNLCLNYEILIILDLSGTPIKELPSNIGNMPCLRYLDLSWTFIEILPETTENFRGIETLRLIGCSRLVRLPREMKRLIQLRHLDLDVVGQLSSMPREMGFLVNLRTLPGFIVGAEEGCKITELCGLNSLTGELRIARLENVLSAMEAKKASLGAKSNLRKLELRWTDYQAQELMTEDDGVLENLCPHSNLEELRILCYNGATLPSWMADESFGMLISITLIRCTRISNLPPFSKLPSLESLELSSLNSVAILDCALGVGDNVGFPKLKKLIIGEMHSLETRIEGEDGDWPSLVELTIMDCPMLTQVPSPVYLPSIQRVEISCCQQLRFAPHKELSASVELLIIEDCPLISERCSKPNGEDWCMIKNVRNIWIDQEAVQADDEDSKVLDQDDRNIGSQTE